MCLKRKIPKQMNLHLLFNFQIEILGLSFILDSFLRLDLLRSMRYLKMTPSKTNIYLPIKLELEAVISVAFKLEPTHLGMYAVVVQCRQSHRTNILYNAMNKSIDTVQKRIYNVKQILLGLLQWGKIRKFLPWLNLKILSTSFFFF